MRNVLVIVTCVGAWLAPASAHADEEPVPSPLLLAYTRSARDAAAAGHCAMAREIGARVSALDSAYHRETFATDPVISGCQPREAVPAPASVIVTEPDPMPPTRTVRQVVAGTLIGALVGAGGFVAGFKLCLDDKGEFSCLGTALLGGAVGISLGAAIGVNTIGSTEQVSGSFGWTLAGAVIGEAIGFAVTVASQGILFPALLVGPVVGASIAFDRTRSLDASSLRAGSLLRIDDHRVSVGIPLVTHGEQRGTTVWLLAGSF